ncbi:hypothetical protein [Limosilactobacillus secaliphilus]|uniref:Uncharacterized protein n=1 Tax=Limosilactobacillus secaliphilus TaxID=396268 RepID=A0A0R2I704_9LACO|nr:hypothetical protein [Limosilactobacillus secaliphilus]KRN58309.1 hypothetical protein IV45_GL000754 [Limosilactobacillus secaliphilus]
MSDKLVAYKDLSADAKKQARLDFMNFYIRQLRLDNLEVVSANASDEDMANINHLLEENQYLTIDKLVELAERMVPNLFDAVESSLDMQYHTDGTTAESWNEWMQKIHQGLPVED